MTYLKLKQFLDQIISASSGDLGANPKLIFQLSENQEKLKFDEILSKFTISNFCNFCP